MYPEKFIKSTNQSRVSEAGNVEKSYLSKKSGLSKTLKVSTLDIRIKQLGLKVSHSKVPSSELSN